MVRRVVTADIRDPNDAPWPGAAVRFTPLVNTFTLNPDVTYPREIVIALTGSSGEMQATLAADTGTAYRVTMPDGEEFDIIVPFEDGSETTLEELRRDYSGTPPAIAAFANLLAIAKLTDPNGFRYLGWNDSLNTMAFLHPPWINIKDRGAVESGGGTQHTIIQAALDEAGALSRDGTVYCPPGNWRCTAGLTIPEGVELILATGAVLDFSAAPAGAVLITAVGVEANSTLLTIDAAEGTTSVTVAGVTGLVPGDTVRIGSNRQFDSLNTKVPIGELNRIQAIVGNVITLAMPTQFAYLVADGAVLSEIDPVRRIRVRGGGKILGGGEGLDHRALFIDKGDDIIVEGIEFEKTSVTGVELRDCTNARVIHNLFHTFYDNATAYGVAVSCACADVLIAYNHFDDVRHALTVSGSTLVKGIPRRIEFSHNTIIDSSGPLAGGTGSGDAVDTHGAADEVRILDNIIHASSGNAINCEGRNVVVRGNQITMAGTVSGIAISVKNLTDYDGDAEISDNVIRGSFGHGIRCSNSHQVGAISSYRGITVHDNLILEPFDAGIWVDSPTTERNTHVSIEGNTVVGAGSTAGAIYVEKAALGTISGNVVSMVPIEASGIRADDSSNLVITDNAIELPAGTIGQGIFLKASAVGEAFGHIIDANRVYTPSSATAEGLLIEDDVINCTIGPSNDFRSCTLPIDRGTGTGHRDRSSREKVQTVTIVADAITIDDDTTVVYVDTEGLAATDNLATINGGIDGQKITVYAANNARDVVIIDNTGNIRSAGDFTMDTDKDIWSASYRGGTWNEITRSNN